MANVTPDTAAVSVMIFQLRLIAEDLDLSAVKMRRAPSETANVDSNTQICLTVDSYLTKKFPEDITRYAEYLGFDVIEYDGAKGPRFRFSRIEWTL